MFNFKNRVVGMVVAGALTGAAFGGLRWCIILSIVFAGIALVKKPTILLKKFLGAAYSNSAYLFLGSISTSLWMAYKGMLANREQIIGMSIVVSMFSVAAVIKAINTWRNRDA